MEFVCLYLKEINVDVEDSSWNASFLFAFSPEVKCNVYTAVIIFKLLLNNKSGNTFFFCDWLVLSSPFTTAEIVVKS